VLAIVPYLAWKWRYALLALPLVVAFARVYVGAHLPLDVVAGFAIGAAAASLTHLAFGIPVTTERRPRSVPPSLPMRQSTEQRAGPG
jgi:undecaprenyl-diphosphatase